MKMLVFVGKTVTWITAGIASKIGPLISSGWLFSCFLIRFSTSLYGKSYYCYLQRSILLVVTCFQNLCSIIGNSSLLLGSFGTQDLSPEDVLWKELQKKRLSKTAYKNLYIYIIYICIFTVLIKSIGCKR